MSFCLVYLEIKHTQNISARWKQVVPLHTRVSVLHPSALEDKVVVVVVS